ncbi:endonuclease/exonuclease/phosphatase family protein [Christiangramia sp. SM2212]|uniref:Endonuclease/exonuclease/phosphatase family protein n=1 Tax=Christiangramia sediminicola TaxID=3073267 RepID=A0ABU1EQ88_9FLAO|nr:endonuclease/exonuclease/phosphatase family protein [Christiangramia sp. SM2212]MDR5590554.1 endonuclease/exonuclease/phosphatase family protein [Christiangramia sp. SM2212]
MSIGEITLLFFTVLMCIPTLASLTRFDQWWVRGFDFPRIQISFLIICVIVASIIFYDFEKLWQFIAVGLLGLSLLYQFKKIYPYTYISKKQVLKFKGSDPNATVSILVSNVLTPNKRSDKLISLVNDRKPDILLTLETDKRWEEELSELEEEYKYNVKIPKDNLYGMHLYSKLELKDIKVRYLVQDDIPSIHGYVILRSGKKVRLHCLHPMPPSPTESETSTNRDAELLMVGRDVDVEKDSILVVGDLNDVAWSRTTRLFQKLSGLMDPRIGRGFFNTFHSNYFLLRWPLDHVFHTKDFTLIEIARERNVGSDHFPMYIKLNYEPTAEVINEDTDEADDEEKEWAEEKIKSADPIRQKLDIIPLQNRLTT